MIVSLRGSNGSGKSTIVRRIMELYDIQTEIKYPGRMKPTGYVCQRGDHRLFVPGHYEIANGGVDTLPDLDTAYDLIKTHALELGCDVLYEGKNMSDGVRRLLELRDAGLDVSVAHLDLPVRECVAAVRARGHKIKIETIERLSEKCAREAEKFEKAGVEVYSGDRAGALAQVRRWLKI